MSGFTPTVRYETDFGDDHITMSLKRLKRKDFMKLSPYMGEPDGEGNMRITFQSQLEMMNVIGTQVPEYVENFQGLTDANGQALGIETVVEEVYFQDLLGEIIQELMRISHPSEADLKKSEAPQPASSGA